MSHAAVNWVLADLDLNGLSPAERWVLVVLADHASRDAWTCFPSHKTLGEECGITPRTILTHLATLEGRGLIVRTPRFRSDGTRSTDLIRLMGSEKFSPPPEKDDPDQVKKSARKPAQIAAHNQGREPGKGTEVVEAREPDADPFDRWWVYYPRKVAKASARKAFWGAFPKVKGDTPFTALIEATERFAEEVKGRPVEKIPHPATWLNEERWNDEPGANGRQADERQPALADRDADRATARLQAMVGGARQAVNSGRRRWGL